MPVFFDTFTLGRRGGSRHWFAVLRMWVVAAEF
jgi:hypothetical protein